MKLSIYALLLFVSFSLLSCGNEDNDEPQDNDPNLYPKSQAFVGYWEANEITGLILFDDGTCISSQTEIGSYRNNINGVVITSSFFNNYHCGIWSYNSNTGILSNSANNKSYEVMRVDATSMLCIDIQTRETIEYKKLDSDIKAIRMALSCDWVSSQNDTISIDYTMLLNLGRYSTSNSYGKCYYSKSHSGLFINLSKDNNKLNYTICFPVAAGNIKTEYTGDLIIENMYSPKKQRIIFSGGINGTYYKKN